MSAEPVAWMDNLGRIVRRIDIEAGGVVGTERAIPDNWTPLQSPSVARAMAIAECARVCERMNGEQFMMIGEASSDVEKHKRGAKTAMGMEIAAAIRALSSPPSVSEEWVEKQIKDAFWQSCGKRDDNALAKNAVRATLAALGVEVKS